LLYIICIPIVSVEHSNIKEEVMDKHNKSKGHINFSSSSSTIEPPDHEHIFKLDNNPSNHVSLYIGLLKQHNIYSFKFCFQNELNLLPQQQNNTPITQNTNNDDNSSNNNNNNNRNTNYVQQPNITVREASIDNNGAPLNNIQIWECYLIARHWGETTESVLFSSKNGETIKVDIVAKAIRSGMGTPVLKNGVKCIGKTVDEETDWTGFDHEDTPNTKHNTGDKPHKHTHNYHRAHAHKHVEGDDGDDEKGYDDGDDEIDGGDDDD